MSAAHAAHATDDTAPAIVGVAQIVQRPGDRSLDDAWGPIELMVDAARAAAQDAGAAGLLARVGFVGVAGGWFRYTNPGQLIAAQIGVPEAATMLTPISGTSPQDLLAIAADRIARGQIDVALVVGGEARWSHQRLSREGREPAWNMSPGEGVPEVLASYPEGIMSEGKVFHGAPAGYALFEDRVRSSRGATVAEHRDHIAALWAGFSAVAAANPYAWDRGAKSAAEIRDPSPDNRMIAFPYTKALVANNTVDMATAILLCSVEAARTAGVASDRLVFPQVVTSSHETWMVVERRELDGSPALATAGRTAFAHTGLGPDDFDHIDLYACFPAIVEMSSAALGIGTDRALTITGGLGFAGAPVGNAVGHSIAAMVDRVRHDGIGLIHGNGGFATKHSFGIYAQQPPQRFAKIDVQDAVDLQPRTALAEDWSGPVTVEAATLMFDREGPSHVLAAVLDSTGERGWATSRDAAMFDAVTSDGLAGREASRTAEGVLQL